MRVRRVYKKVDREGDAAEGRREDLRVRMDVSEKV